MNRRELLKKSATLALMVGTPAFAPDRLFGGVSGEQQNGGPNGRPADAPSPLIPPAAGPIPVAFVISDGAVVIDFAGPWEVFQDVHDSHGKGFFRLYTVAETNQPIAASAGMKIVPEYTFQTAPQPKVIVIPAQNGESTAMLEWIRKSTKTTDITMSVCTGAFVLAKTGLLSGKPATTHHGAYTEFAMEFPDIHLRRGARFVEAGNLASAGGLSSGIDLALRVVERYFGRERAEQTANMMEYQGRGWLDPDSNQAYAKAPASSDGHPVCPICAMDADPSIKSVVKGRNYYFCSQEHKSLFDKDPEKFANNN